MKVFSGQFSVERHRGEAAWKLTRRVSEGERFQTRRIHSRLERSPSLTRRVSSHCGCAAMFNPYANGVGVNSEVEAQATLGAHAEGVAVKQLRRTSVSEDQLVIAIGVTFLAWVVVVLTNFFATSEALAFTPQTNRKAARTVGTIAIVHGGLALAIAAYAIALLMDASVAVPHPRVKGDISGDLCLVFAVVAVVFCLTSAVSAVLLMQIKMQLSRLTDERDKSVADSVYAAATVARRWGLATPCVGLVAMMIVVPPLLIFVAVSAALGVPFVVMANTNRRPSQLLWLLAVAVKHRRNLADELRAHAIGQSEGYGRRLMRCADSIDAGDSLGEALEQVLGLLPKWVVSEIRIGEATMTLDSTLARLAQQQLATLDWDLTRVTLTSWATYGVTYAMAGFSIVGFLMIFIVPKFKAIFNGFETELPKVTELAIKLADLFADYWFLFAPLMWAFGWLAIEVMRGEATRWKHLRYRILSPLYRVLDGPDILRQLSLIVSSGRSLTDGLTAMARFHHRPSVAKLLARVSIDVQAGDDCFERMRQQRLISAADESFLASAQRVGNLGWALNELAEIRERRLTHWARFWLEAFRPVPVLIAGVLVFFLAAAFFMPIVKLLNDLS